MGFSPIKASRIQPRLILAVPIGGALLLALSPQFLYFLIHNPDSVTFLTVQTLLENFKDFAVSFFFLMGLIGLGNYLVSSYLCALVLAESLCACLVMGLGLAGLLNQKTLASIFLLVSSAGLLNPRLRESSMEFFRSLYRKKVSPSSFFCAALVSLALASAAAWSGSPPTDWDSLAYHLAFPKIFLQAQRLVGLEWSFNIHYALNPEMIYTLLYSLRGAQAVHWMNFLHGAVLLAAVYGFVKKYFSSPAAWLALGLLVAQPIFWTVHGNASTDFFVTLASFAALASYIEGKDPFLCGLMAGAAASSKLTGLWVAGALFVLQGLSFLKGKRKIEAKNIGKFILGAALLGSPWYLRNWIWKGNPFWPYFGRIFGGSPADLALAQRSTASVTEGLPKTFFNWVLSPVWIFIKQSAFGQRTYFLIPVFLSGLAWKLLKDRASLFTGATKQILLFIAVFWSFWFWIYQMWRYFLPAMVWTAVLSAVWIYEGWSRGRVFRACALILMILAVSPVIQINSNNQLFVFFGLNSKSAPFLTPQERYLDIILGPVYRIERDANRFLPPSAKLALYKEVRGFYLDREYAWVDPLNPGAIPYDRMRTKEDIYGVLRQNGFTHVLYNPFTGGYQGDPVYYGRCNALMLEFIGSYTRPALMDSGLAIYEIKPLGVRSQVFTTRDLTSSR